jgi:hypothetical protein
LNIHYHPGKANVVADALSRKHYCNNLMVREEQPALHEVLERLSLEIVEEGQLNELQVKYTLEDQIRQDQKEYPKIQEVKRLMESGKAADYRLDEQGTLWLKDRICVPQNKEIRDSILKKSHDSRYSIHPGCTKMYKDLKIRPSWEKMREDIAEYVARCDTCQRVRPNTRGLPGCYNRSRYPHGSGIISVWTSLWVCHARREGMTPYG